MKSVNNLLIGLALFACVSLQAATKSETFTTNETRSSLTAASRVSTVVVAAGGSAVTVKLYDSNTSDITYTSGAFTNITTYVTNLVTSYVTTTGITNNLTNKVLYVVKQVSAAATNTLPVSASLSVSANETVTFPVDLVFGRGVTIDANTNATVTVTYQSQKSNL